jgi:hypothetical protein
MDIANITNSSFQTFKPLIDLNVTRIDEVSKEQIINICNSVSTIPSLIILFIASYLSFLILGLIIVKKSRDKLLIIWFSSFVIGLIVLLTLIFLPNTIYDFISKIFGV